MISRFCNSLRFEIWCTVVLLLALSGESTAVMPFNADTVSRSVVYIFGPPDPAGNVHVATGFLLVIPLASDPDRGPVFLITARHVVDPRWACAPEPNPTYVNIRLNKKQFRPEAGENGTNVLTLPLIDYKGNRLWLAHTNPSVDLAVIRVDPRVVEDYEHVALPYSQIATRDEIVRDVVVGADIATAGLIPELVDEKRNYPLFKFGKISSLPAEPVRVPCMTNPTTRRTESLWYAATNAVPGNSGSPVIFVPDFLNIGVSRRAMVIGLLSTSDLGADVAGIVPVEYLDEIFRASFADLDLTRGMRAGSPATPVGK